MWLAKVCSSSWSCGLRSRAPDVEEPDGTAHGGERHRLGSRRARVEGAAQAGGDPGLGRHPAQFVRPRWVRRPRPRLRAGLPTGSTRATLREANASWTVETMSSRTSDRGRSSMRRSVSSKSRRMACSCWRASVRAASRRATTLATSSITATYTTSTTQFSLAPTDRREVGRDEHEVVDEEAGDHGEDPGAEAPDDHAAHDRDHEDERRGGDAEVTAEGHHHGHEGRP